MRDQDEDRERMRKYMREYYRRNREKILEYQREYYRRNRGRRLEQQREYYRKNRERILKRRKEHRQKRRAKILKYSRNKPTYRRVEEGDEIKKKVCSDYIELRQKIKIGERPDPKSNLIMCLLKLFWQKEYGWKFKQLERELSKYFPMISDNRNGRPLSRVLHFSQSQGIVRYNKERKRWVLGDEGECLCKYLFTE